MTRMSIDVPRSLHKVIKYAAMIHDQTIRDFVVEAIEQKIAREPNDVTLNTFQASDAGKELHAYNSFSDFLDEMENED